MLTQLGWIYDSCLLLYRMAERQDPELFNSKLQQRQLAGLRKDFPEFATVYRRAQAGAVNRAEVNWNKYAHPREGKKPAGIPRLKGGRFRTIDIRTSSSKLLTFTRAGRPKLEIKGLPTIRLTGHRMPPKDEQPNKITITLKGRRILVRLGYPHELPTRKDPRRAANPLGADVGIAISIATSNGDTYRSPKEEKLTGQIKDAQRKLTGIISAAIATRKAGVRAVLNLPARPGAKPVGGWEYRRQTTAQLRLRPRLVQTGMVRNGLVPSRTGAGPMPLNRSSSFYPSHKGMGKIPLHSQMQDEHEGLRLGGFRKR